MLVNVSGVGDAKCTVQFDVVIIRITLCYFGMGLSILCKCIRLVSFFMYLFIILFTDVLHARNSLPFLHIIITRASKLSKSTLLLTNRDVFKFSKIVTNKFKINCKWLANLLKIFWCESPSEPGEVYFKQRILCAKTCFRQRFVTIWNPDSKHFLLLVASFSMALSSITPLSYR